jgi:Ni,Fe-hydrogenase maturation factor
MRKKIGIIGLGNSLQRDDGIGLVLLQHLQTQKKIYQKISNILMVAQVG